MTTPDTSDVRTWARKNGYDVADRGRLPAEVTEAYQSAHGGAAKKKATPSKATAAKKAAPVRKSTATKARATSASTARKPAPAPKAVPQKAAPVSAPAPQPVKRAAEAAPEQTPRPKPSVVTDDRRLVALGEEIKALTQRVEALEKSSGGSKAGPSKAARFRRRS